MIPIIEKEDKQEIEQYQLKELKKLLNYLEVKSPFYRRLFQERSINSNEFTSLKDLHHIPTTTKADLQKYQRDFWCVSKKEIVEYCNTSGTEGKAIIVPMTAGDVERLAYNEAISLACCGGNENEIYQLTTTIDRQFMAGLAYSLGARRLNAGMIRVGPGLPQLQWQTIHEIQPTALIIVPSFLLKLIEYAENNNINFAKSSVKRAICIGEPIRDMEFSLNALGKRIAEKWDIELYSTYASTEMGTAFTECSAQNGGHLHPELLIAEILDENGDNLPIGEIGELVVTTLGVEAMPLLRFRTGDIVRFDIDDCSCGRNTPRISPILGRKNQLIKYKGTTCYPPAIADVMDGDKSIRQYQIEVNRDMYGNDNIIIRYSRCTDHQLSDLIDQFRSKLRVVPALEMVTDEEITSRIYVRSSRKPLKFVDNR